MSTSTGEGASAPRAATGEAGRRGRRRAQAPAGPPRAGARAVSQPAPQPLLPSSGSPTPVELPSPAATPAAPAAAPAGSSRAGWRRLASASSPRPSRGNLLAAVLAAALGLAISVQVVDKDTEDLASLSEPELVQLLSNVEERSDRLDEEESQLQALRSEIAASRGSDSAALEAAQERYDNLRILAGLVPVEGPGIEITIVDAPQRTADKGMRAMDLLDAVQELRDAGAESIQVGNVRVVARSAFTEADGGVIRLDGQDLSTPYRIKAIGDPHTLRTAMMMPGGLVESSRQRDARTTVVDKDTVSVDALRAPSEAKYARPVDQPGQG